MSERKEKFTQGPWYSFRSTAGKCWTIASTEAAEFEIAEERGEDMSVAGIWCSERDPTPKANAHLIAAAPELYAICDEIREAFAYFSEWDLPIGFEGRLDAALAKARGEA